MPGGNAGAHAAVRSRSLRRRTGEFPCKSGVIDHITQFRQSGFSGLKPGTAETALLRYMDMADRGGLRGQRRPHTQTFEDQPRAV